MAVSKSSRVKVVFFSSLVVFTIAARAADWPTYRHDNARSGCTSESLETPLVLDWVYVPVHPPRPAWPPPAKRPREGFLLRHRIDFDDAFQISAAGDLVYFPAGTSHKLTPLRTPCRLMLIFSG